VTKLLIALLGDVYAGESARSRDYATALLSAADIRAFTAGKTVVGVFEPLDNHTRFVFSDSSSLLVVTSGPVAYYAEPRTS
jgi:hypothetical protein